MNFLTIVLIALGLAMDAFAVSLSSGVMIKEKRVKHALIFGACFGLFQFAMPVLGWLLGTTFAGYITSFDHWIAFSLLLFIGVKMLVEALRKKKDGEPPDGTKSILRPGNMLLLGLATSIDALAVGVSFAVMDQNVWISSAVIGAVAFILSAAGIFIGERLGKAFGKAAGIFGGLVLIAIGVKILLEHLLA